MRAVSASIASSSSGCSAMSERPCAYAAVEETGPARARSASARTPGVEHGSRPLCDPAVELLLRDVEPEDERRMARVVGPEPIALACSARELEAADDAPAVVRVDGRRRLGIDARRAGGARCRGLRRRTAVPGARARPDRVRAAATGRTGPPGDRGPCRRRRSACAPSRGSRRSQRVRAADTRRRTLRGRVARFPRAVRETGS